MIDDPMPLTQRIIPTTLKKPPSRKSFLTELALKSTKELAHDNILMAKAPAIRTVNSGVSKLT